MDIRKLILFEDVANTQNFTKSGDKLGYTQSGVSHMLKSLEDELGFTLFIRSKQGVKLTDSGLGILPAVRSLLSKYENLTQTVNEIHGIEKGSLTIATFSSISIHYLPKIIHEFKEKYPSINIELLEGGTDDIVSWVENDIADFGFLSHENTKNLEWITLAEDPLLAIMPKDSELPESGAINIEFFQDKPFIMTSMGTDYDVHKALTTSNVTPNAIFSSKDDHAIISMVSNALGVSILPGLVVKGFENQVSCYAINPYYSRTLGIALKSREALSPAAKKFIKLATTIISSNPLR
ncbi:MULTISPECIES: LysR family transcriptional regulator [unclassified Butyrivibrio]|uniref:LysR family transcriptional regulator n=1 Tax=unclassified Butyrivibrio TaxID=2639466 RepID=UPI0004138020|nr:MULTISPECIES: LysR substrate-binding domain-containing protein [unclassified Butyrivibrio]